MYQPAGVTTSPEFPVPAQMKAWVLGDPDELCCATNQRPFRAAPKFWSASTPLRSAQPISRSSTAARRPASAAACPSTRILRRAMNIWARSQRSDPMSTSSTIGERVSVEIHAGCGQCKRCRQGMYTSCLNYGKPDKGHRANGFTTDGGFAEYAVNHINTLARVPDTMSDAEATLVVTAGTSMYGLTELGGLVAGESVVVIGPGPIGLLAVAVAKALGASPVILTGTRNKRLAIGKELGADRVINIAEENAVDVVKAAHRRHRRGLCGRVRRHRGHRQSGHSHGQSRRKNLPRGIPARARHDGPRASREEQYLRLRHSRRRPQRHAPCDGADGRKAVRCDEDPHPHLCARRSAHRAAIRARPGRGRHQGGGHHPASEDA